jgi:hypothetical protein
VRDFTGNVASSARRRGCVSFQQGTRQPVPSSVMPISDPVFYQDFFSRLDKSVYLQKERL